MGNLKKRGRLYPSSSRKRKTAANLKAFRQRVKEGLIPAKKTRNEEEAAVNDTNPAVNEENAAVNQENAAVNEGVASVSLSQLVSNARNSEFRFGPYTIKGRRIVDVSYFISELLKLNGHSESGNCCLGDMATIMEYTKGIVSGFVLKCKVCKYRSVIWTENPDDETKDMNVDAIMGMMSSKGGFWNVNDYFKKMKLPKINQGYYRREFNRVKKRMQMKPEVVEDEDSFDDMLSPAEEEEVSFDDTIIIKGESTTQSGPEEILPDLRTPSEEEFTTSQEMSCSQNGESAFSTIKTEADESPSRDLNRTGSEIGRMNEITAESEMSEASPSISRESAAGSSSRDSDLKRTGSDFGRMNEITADSNTLEACTPINGESAAGSSSRDSDLNRTGSEIGRVNEIAADSNMSEASSSISEESAAGNPNREYDLNRTGSEIDRMKKMIADLNGAEANPPSNGNPSRDSGLNSTSSEIDRMKKMIADLRWAETSPQLNKPGSGESTVQERTRRAATKKNASIQNIANTQVKSGGDQTTFGKSRRGIKRSHGANNSLQKSGRVFPYSVELLVSFSKFVWSKLFMCAECLQAFRDQEILKSHSCRTDFNTPPPINDISKMLTSETSKIHFAVLKNAIAEKQSSLRKISVTSKRVQRAMIFHAQAKDRTQQKIKKYDLAIANVKSLNPPCKDSVITDMVNKAFSMIQNSLAIELRAEKQLKGAKENQLGALEAAVDATLQESLALEEFVKALKKDEDEKQEEANQQETPGDTQELVRPTCSSERTKCEEQLQTGAGDRRVETVRATSLGDREECLGMHQKASQITCSFRRTESGIHSKRRSGLRVGNSTSTSTSDQQESSGVFQKIASLPCTSESREQMQKEDGTVSNIIKKETIFSPGVHGQESQPGHGTSEDEGQERKEDCYRPGNGAATSTDVRQESSGKLPEKNRYSYLPLKTESEEQMQIEDEVDSHNISSHCVQ